MTRLSAPTGPADLTGVTGRAVLTTLMLAGGPGSAPVRSNAPPPAISTGDERPQAVTVITAITVSVAPAHRHQPQPTPTSPPDLPPARPATAHSPRHDHRHITDQPPRDWSGHELAVLLGVKPCNMLTQFGEWSRLGFFTHTGFGTYRLNTPPDATSSTIQPDP